MPDAPEESLPENPLQKEIIFDLLVCVEECTLYTRSNLQLLLHILHSIPQGQSFISMSTATEGVVHMIIDRSNGWRR